MLKCSERIGNSDLEKEGRLPIMLPKHHRLIELIITGWHNGLQSLLAKLRSHHSVQKERQQV